MFVFSVVPAVLGGCTHTGEAEPWKTDPNLIFLHRGARASAPECTIDAITTAYRWGADGVEVDLRLTLDGVVVNYHDESTLIKGRGLLPIEWMTWREVRDLDGGGWFDDEHRGDSIVRFEDILRFAVANGLMLRIDLKRRSVGPFVDELLDRYGARRLATWVHGDRTGGATPASVPAWIGRGGLWTRGIDVDPGALSSLIAGHQAPFSANLDDPRIIVQLLGRRPDRRMIRPPVAERPMPAPPVLAAEDVERALHGVDRRRARIAAWWLIQRRGIDVRPEFVRLLDDPRATDAARQAAAWGLGRIESDSAAGDLATMLRHENSGVRFLAAYGVGMRRIGAAATALWKAAAEDADPDVRAAASWALGRLRDRKAIPVLRRVVRAYTGGREEELPAAHAALALGALRAVPAIEDLAALLTSGRKPITAIAALHALADIGGRAGAATVSAIARSARAGSAPLWTAVALARSLDRLTPQPAAWDGLIRALGRREPILSREAALAIVRHGDAARRRIEAALARGVISRTPAVAATLRLIADSTKKAPTP